MSGTMRHWSRRLSGPGDPEQDGRHLTGRRQRRMVLSGSGRIRRTREPVFRFSTFVFGQRPRSHAMYQRFTVAYTMIAFAFVATAAGCSSASTSSLAAHPIPAGMHDTQLAVGTWTTKASMPTASYGLAAGVINGIL